MVNITLLSNDPALTLQKKCKVRTGSNKENTHYPQ